jgi:hypothetical protein
MKADERAAGAKNTAETAELRKDVPADASGTRRTGKALRKNRGKSVEQLRNLSSASDPALTLPAAPHTAPAPDLVQTPALKMPREISPAETPTRPGTGWPAETPPSLARGLPAHEQAVIDAALAILGNRAREPGAVFDAPHLVSEFLRLHLARCERERFGVMFLDGQHALIAFEVLFDGTLTQTSVYPREVVKRALQLNAGAVVLAHNHPSGLAEPSREDKWLTNALRDALGLVGVRVLDHLVVGWPEVFSFAQNGLMEPEPEPWPKPLRPAPKRRAVRPARALA